MKRFVPLTRKINLIIIISSLVVDVGIVIAYFAYTQNSSLRQTSRGNLRQQSDILFQSIKNAMLPGEAPIAVQLFEDIRLANPAYKIFLLRDNGVQAFSDNSTLEGQTFFTIYKPLLNLPKCSGCHGSSHTVRGVINITSDITPVVNQQRRNVLIASGFFVFVVLILALLLSLYLHGTLIRPVKHIGDVCATVTNGDFSTRVTVSNRDEIEVLGETVNQMAKGPYRLKVKGKERYLSVYQLLAMKRRPE